MIDNNMRVRTIGKIENINSKSDVVADIDSIRGGRLIVADKKQLSLVPVEKCKVGMVIYVQSENKEYTLIQEPTGTIYTDSSDWEVKKTNAEDVYVNNKQNSIVKDYEDKIKASAIQTLSTADAKYTTQTEFKKSIDSATNHILLVEQISNENANKIKEAETNISTNATNLQKLTDNVFGTEQNDGIKQDIDKKIAAMDEKINTNKTDLRSLIDKVGSNGESISAINTDVDLIKKNIGDYKLSQQFQTVDEKISGVNSDLKKAIDDAKTQHTNLGNSISAVSDSLTKHKKSFNIYKGNTNQTIERYGQRLDDVEKAASNNTASLKDTITNLSGLSDKVKENYEEFKTLNTTVNEPSYGLSIQCDKLNKQFIKLYGDYNLNNSVSLSSIARNISTNATNIADNKSAVDATIDSIKEKITGLEDKDNDITSELNTLKIKFDDYAPITQFNKLSTKVDDLSNTANSTKADLDKFRDAVHVYETNTDEKISEIRAGLKTKLDSSYAETFNSTISTVANNVNLASSTATNALDKANKVDGSLRDINNNIAGLTNNISTLTTKVDANKNSIDSINDIIGDREIIINTANHTICDYITDIVRKDAVMQADIKKNADEIKSKAADIIKEYQAADANLDGKIANLISKVETYNTELTNADTGFAKDITTINNTTAANSSAITANKNNIDTLSKNLKDLTTSVSAVDGVASKNKGSIEALQDVVKTNTESINDLKDLQKDKSDFLEKSGLNKDTATAQTLYNATLYTLKGFINTHEISDIEKANANKNTIIANIVENAKAIDTVKASIKTNSDNIDKNTKSISYLIETAKSLKLQPVIEDISSDKSTDTVNVKLDIENIKMDAFKYLTLGIAGRTKEDETTSSTLYPKSSSKYFGIASSLLTDEKGNTNMVTVRGYITPHDTPAEDQIYLESDPMDLTKEFSITYGFIKPETKTINGNTYHQYVELGKTKIHFFDDDGVTIKIKLPDRIADDDANVDDSVKLAIGFTNVDNREADVADSCFAFSLAGAFEATSLDGATEDGGLFIIKPNKPGDVGEIVNHGSFAITSNAIRRAGEVGFVTVFQI